MGRASLALRLAVLLILGPLSFGTLGCRTTTLASDQVDLREGVIKLYEQQLFDNVVRAHRRMPMLLVSYSALQGTVTTKVSGTGTLTKTALDNTFGAALASGNITDADTTTKSLAVTIGRDVALGVKGEPVTTSDPYDRIIKFADTAGSIMSCTTPPEHECEYVVIGKYDGVYYWVPTASRTAFFNLYNEAVLRFNPPKILNSLQELFDFANSPLIQRVQ